MEAGKGDTKSGERAQAVHCPDFGTAGTMAPGAGLTLKDAMRLRTGITLLLLGLAAALAYAPSLGIPLMEDDYPNLSQTLAGGIATPLADPIFRVRATSFWTMRSEERRVGKECRSRW